MTSEASQSVPCGNISERELSGIIEGLLFVSGDALAFDKIAEIIGIDPKALAHVLEKMSQSGEDPSRGVIVRRIENKYQMCTKPQYHQYISRMADPKIKPDLSQAAYETLAVIAYNGPVTKSRIEQIRGVNSDSSIEKLIDRNLVREAGRLELPGRPILFETTEEFLRSFGLRSHSDLPSLPDASDENGNNLSEHDDS